MKNIIIDFLLSAEGNKLITNIGICVVLLVAFKLFIEWMIRRHKNAVASMSKQERIFKNEVIHLKEKFDECTTRRELMHEELEIDRLVWYWSEHKSTEEIQKVHHELYTAFYDRLSKMTPFIEVIG